MFCKKTVAVLVGIFMVFLLLGVDGCSREEGGEKPLLGARGSVEKFRKVPTGSGMQRPEEPGRKKQVANAESCQKEFERCVEKCRKQSCEDVCLRFLDACEKNLPKELRTLKE